MLTKNSVVQFVENHKWCGCFGIIHEVKKCGDDIKYMIGIPVPQGGTVYIFSMGSNHEFEYIGNAVMALPEDGEDSE